MTQANNTITPPKEADLDEFLDKKYIITNDNGQRKYGPPTDWIGPPPPKGSEVFIGKLPRDVFEDELIPIFQKIGPIYEMRLMMDYENNFNRGFAFIMFSHPDDAKKAIDELNRHEIRKSRYIGVCKSVDNCRLFVGGIPKTKTKEEILEEMKKITESVLDVILYSSITDKTKNRGFAFVEYESHKSAAMARRKLIPGKIQLWGKDIAVDWAEPEPEIDEETMSKVTILYARNLMMTTTEEHIKDIFTLEDKLKIEKVKKLRDFAFIHYKTREDAETALEKLNTVEIDGSIVEVTWAKPVDRPRQRNYPRPNQPVPTITPCYYGPAYDIYNGPIPFTNCPGRAGFIPRVAFRGRSRGAAGIRRFRGFPLNSNATGPFKQSEGGNAPNSSSYTQYQSNKLGRIAEEKSYVPEYALLMPVSNAEGIDSTMPMPNPPLFSYAPHPRAHPAFMHPPAGFEDVPCYTYVPNPSGYIPSN